MQVGAGHLLGLRLEKVYLSQFVKFQVLSPLIVLQLLHKSHLRLQLLLKKLLLLSIGVFQLKVRRATYARQCSELVLAGFRFGLLLLSHIGHFSLDPFLVGLVKLFQILD